MGTLGRDVGRAGGRAGGGAVRLIVLVFSRVQPLQVINLDWVLYMGGIGHPNCPFLRSL